MKKSEIHPSSVIHKDAILGQGVKIGPFCTIGANVELGERVELKSHVVLDGYTQIGDDCIIFPFASLGTAPQDLKYNGEPSKLIIGKRNRIREQVTMNPGTAGGGLLTQIGDDGLFMVGVHVAHDCKVGNHVIMANNATLAGHVEVGDYAVIGGLSAVHQFVRIGNSAMIGGMSGVEADVIPYGLVVGERANLRGLNIVGLKRLGFSNNHIREIQNLFNKVFQGEGDIKVRVQEAKIEYADNSNLIQLLNFIEKSMEQRGLTKPSQNIVK